MIATFGLIVGLIVVIASVALAEPKGWGIAIISAIFALCSGIYALGLPVQHDLVNVTMAICCLAIGRILWKNVSKVQIAAGAICFVAASALLFAGAVVTSYENSLPSTISVNENGSSVEYELTGELDESQVRTISNNIRLASNNNDERKIVFWANYAPEGSNNMGPEMHFETLDDAIARQSEKMETDPVWFANKIEGLINGSKVDPEKVNQRAKYYIQNPDVWENHIARVQESFGPAYEADFGSTRYESQGMYPGKTKDDMPTVTKFSVQPEMGKVFIQKYKPGYWNVTEEIMREACDLQPSNTTGFPNIPKPSTPEKAVNTPPKKYTPPVKTVTPPPVKTTTPPVTKTTTPQPPVTKTTTPPVTKTTTPPVTKTTTPPVTTTTTTQPPVTTTTTTQVTTTKTPPPVTTTTTTQPPVTTTTPKCPPQFPNCKDPEAGPDAPEGHTTAEAPVGEPEKELPPEPKPFDPKVTEEAPIPAQDNVVAPDATPPSVEERDKVKEATPPVTEIAPQPEQPGTEIADPDAPTAATQTAQSDTGNAEVKTQENHQANAPTEAPETEAPAVELTSANEPEKAGFAGNGLMTIIIMLLAAYTVLQRFRKEES